MTLSDMVEALQAQVGHRNIVPIFLAVLLVACRLACLLVGACQVPWENPDGEQVQGARHQALKPVVRPAEGVKAGAGAGRRAEHSAHAAV